MFFYKVLRPEEFWRNMGGGTNPLSQGGASGNGASATLWPKTQEAILKFISPFSDLVMIAGFAIIGYAIYEFIQSMASDSMEPRKKSVTMLIVGLLMLSAKAILSYIIGG